MGPQALRVSGALTDGILPLLAGPRALADHLVPAVTAITEVPDLQAGRLAADDRSRRRGVAGEGLPEPRRTRPASWASRAGRTVVSIRFW